MCERSDIEEQRGHKVVTVMSIEFDLLLLVSLQYYKRAVVMHGITLIEKSSIDPQI